MTAGLPPWLLPLAIVHVAMALVLLYPAMRAFSKAGARFFHAFWLFLPAIGLVVVAMLMMARVMPATGKPRLLALLVIVPFVNVMFLWLLAFGAWSEAGRASRPKALSEDAVTGRRESPTLTGTAGSSPGVGEPTLQPNAAAKAAVAEPTLGAPAGADKDAATGTPAASAPAPRDAVATAAGEMATTGPGDQTVVAGARSGEQVAGTKSRTKIVERADDIEPERPSDATAAGAAGAADDLVSATPADAFDREGEPANRDTLAAADDGAALRKAGVSEADMTLAKGVLEDLDLDGKSAEPDPTESPIAAEMPLVDAPENRVWLVQGVNARAANIEASIREEDVSRSVTGILVGRSNRADFIIDDESVSRNHARFVYLDGGLHVEDLDSMNGTWVDGEKLEGNRPQPLRRVSDLEFGKIRLEVKEQSPS